MSERHDGERRQEIGEKAATESAPPHDGQDPREAEWHASIGNLMGPNRPPPEQGDPPPAAWLHRFLGC